MAEADDAERERRRNALHEPYRTLLGHLRHEIGHYYWDRLIAAATRSMRFASVRRRTCRLRRGAEAALRDRPARPTGSHASSPRTRRSHPWEDWAETWAHYLHMTDTLETAAACGVSLRPRRADEPAMPRVPSPPVARSRLRSPDDQLVSADLRAQQPESRPRPARRLPVVSCRRRPSTSCASSTTSSRGSNRVRISASHMTVYGGLLRKAE